MAAINAHDVAAILAFLAPKFVMVDSLGNRLPREQMPSGWKQYFSMVPDYWIKVQEEIADKNRIFLLGQAGGTYVAPGGAPQAENKWQSEAVWCATVSRGKLTEWRIWADNEPIREKMRAATSR